MYPENNSSSTPPNDVPTWFQGAQTPAPTPTPPPKKISRTLLAAIIGGVIVIFGIGVLLLVVTKNKPCLTAADYASLTGAKVDASSLSSTANFYTSTVAFATNASTYGNSRDQEISGSALIKKVSEFYNSHSESSIAIALKGAYASDSALTLTQQRIDTVKASLLANGIPESLITTYVPEYAMPEDDAPGDPSSVVISITSYENCT